MLGVSPTLIRRRSREYPTPTSSPRSITTTASPGTPVRNWLNEHVAGGGRIPIVNISGTEVGAWPGRADGADEARLARLPGALGQAMDVYSPEGKPLRGEVYEPVSHQLRPE